MLPSMNDIFLVFIATLDSSESIFTYEILKDHEVLAPLKERYQRGKLATAIQGAIKQLVEIRAISTTELEGQYTHHPDIDVKHWLTKYQETPEDAEQLFIAQFLTVEQAHADVISDATIHNIPEEIDPQIEIEVSDEINSQSDQSGYEDIHQQQFLNRSYSDNAISDEITDDIPEESVEHKVETQNNQNLKQPDIEGKDLETPPAREGQVQTGLRGGKGRKKGNIFGNDHVAFNPTGEDLSGFPQPLLSKKDEPEANDETANPTYSPISSETIENLSFPPSISPSGERSATQSIPNSISDINTDYQLPPRRGGRQMTTSGNRDDASYRGQPSVPKNPSNRDSDFNLNPNLSRQGNPDKLEFPPRKQGRTPEMSPRTQQGGRKLNKETRTNHLYGPRQSKKELETSHKDQVPSGYHRIEFEMPNGIIKRLDIPDAHFQMMLEQNNQDIVQVYRILMGNDEI